MVVATKWWPLLRTARNIPHTIQDRLRHLDGFGIDLYMVHQPFSFSSPEAEMDAMADLVEAGKICSVGVSNFSAEICAGRTRELEKRGLSLAANQVLYSLLNRSIESNGILETAKELGVTIIAYTPLASGLLTGKYHNNPELLGRNPSSGAAVAARAGEKPPAGAGAGRDRRTIYCYPCPGGSELGDPLSRRDDRYHPRRDPEPARRRKAPRRNASSLAATRSPVWTSSRASTANASQEEIPWKKRRKAQLRSFISRTADDLCPSSATPVTRRWSIS